MATVDFILGWAEGAELLDGPSARSRKASAPRVIAAMAIPRGARLWREISVDHTMESSWAAAWVGELRDRVEASLDEPFPSSILLRYASHYPRLVGEERLVAFDGPFETEAFPTSEAAVAELLARAVERADPLEGIDYRESSRPVDPADLPP
jgi:hypothetical protein